jgi:hypothetical protein
MFAASKTDSASTGGYQISRSLRFNSADSAYLNRTPASATNQKTWTWSGWVKRSALRANLSDPATLFNAGGNGFNARFSYANPDQLEFYNYSGAAFQLNLATTAVYRDVSAWYHIVFALDTTQATDTNRFKVYVNGTQVTAFSTATYPSQNSDMLVNGTSVHALGVLNGIGGYYSGYMTEVNFIDGQALTPSSFGETNADTGVWQPKAYSGSYGTNGFYLNFSDNSNTTAATLGKDYSGNGNNWTPNNFSVTAGAGNDSLVDSPTSYGTDTGVGGTVRGNYCTWNPLGSVLGAGSATNGNLDVACADSTTGAAGSRGTMATTSGQWYFEVLVVSGGTYSMIGVSDANKVITSAGWGSLNAWCYYGNTGSKYGNGTDSAYGATYTNGDLIGVAYDSDAGTLTFYKNGTSQGQAYTGLTGKALSPFVGTASGTMTFTLNAGQRPFAYTAPSGYKALCTQNLPTPTIGATTATQAGKYFNTVLYTGNAGTLAVTGVGFQPDFVWAKGRSVAYSHGLFDAVRGATLKLTSNSTNAEATESGLTAFNSDGFTLGSDVGLNSSSATYVSWNWKANGSGSTNTSGSITSTVSANTTSGFSVVTFTTQASGTATVGHGLGVAPAFIITKLRGAANNWNSYHVSLGNSASINLNQTDAVFTGSTNWNNTSPTSSVFSLGSNWAGSYTVVAYCFAEISGYSKFGSYTGNGSTDGPFVYTGFRPAFVLFKRTDATSDWWMYDTKRSPSNVIDIILWPNYSDAEGTGASIAIDILSNGFKPRSNNGTFNGSGGTYIFMAFASAPLKFSLAR